MRRKDTNNEFLKECMADSLMKLMKNESFDKISITEITQVANVGRVTFYRNFNSKKDLLIYKFNLMFMEWFESKFKDIDEFNNKSYKYLLVEFLNLIYNLKDDFLVIYKANAFTIFQDFLYDGLWIHITLDEKLKYRKAFFSYALYGVTLYWIESGFNKTPDEIVDIIINDIKLILT